MIRLDQNAGIEMLEECKDIYDKYCFMNNIRGYSKKKR